MIFVDLQTRTVVANQADAESHLTKDGNVFIGKLPENMNIANTAIQWAGGRLDLGTKRRLERDGWRA